jgi:transcriptional regulator with XRE-family HTH domain
METINERLIYLIGDKRGVKSKLAKFLDISDSTLSTYVARGTKIPSFLIPKIADFFNVSEAYLLTGKEEKQVENILLSREEIEMLKYFRGANEKAKGMALGVLMSNQEDSEESKKGA